MAYAERNVAVMEETSKFLTFRLDGEDYGVEILKVQEIIGLMPITRVPRVPGCVRGVINLRGRVIPVVDLRRKFALGEREFSRRTCIIVVGVERESGPMVLGIIVDEVAEVVDVESGQIDPPPEIGMACDREFLLGLAKLEDRVVILLELDRVLAESELSLIGSATAT